MAGDRIPRDEIARIFPNRRSADVFERMQVQIEEAGEASALAVAATTALNEAAFVTLSENAELPNERVLQFGTGIGATLTDTTVTLKLTNAAARAEGGFRVTFISAGDALLGAPLTGYLATREWVNAQGFGAGGGALPRAKGRFVYG